MIPFVGGSYVLNTRKADVQRAVNLFPVANEVPGGKTAAYLQSAPGLDLFSAAASPPAPVLRGFDPSNSFAATLNAPDQRIAVIAPGATSGWSIAKKTQNFGKYYFEIKLLAKVGFSQPQLGIGATDAPGGVFVNNIHAATPNGYVVFTDGSGGSIALPALNVGDVLGFTIDLNDGLGYVICISRNGVFPGSMNPTTGANPMFTGNSITPFNHDYAPEIYVANGIVGDGSSAELYTEAGTFKYPVPVGFVPWAGQVVPDYVNQTLLLMQGGVLTDASTHARTISTIGSGVTAALALPAFPSGKAIQILGVHSSTGLQMSLNGADMTQSVGPRCYECFIQLNTGALALGNQVVFNDGTGTAGNIFFISSGGLVSLRMNGVTTATLAGVTVAEGVPTYICAQLNFDGTVHLWAGTVASGVASGGPSATTRPSTIIPPTVGPYVGYMPSDGSSNSYKFDQLRITRAERYAGASFVIPKALFPTVAS